MQSGIQHEKEALLGMRYRTTLYSIATCVQYCEVKDIIDKYFKTDSILAELTISLLVGVGGFSTLLPKTVESISTVRDYTSFDALTYFSLIYFLLPGFIVVTYWQYRGWKKFIDRKLETISLARNGWDGSVIGSLYCTIFKLIVIFLLFYSSALDVYFLFILCGLFLSISLVEVYMCARNIFSYTAFDENNIQLTDKNLNNLRYFIFFTKDKAVEITILMSLLNVFTAVGLCLIVKPWLLYWDLTMILFNVVLSIYLIILVLLIKYNTLLSRKEISILFTNRIGTEYAKGEHLESVYQFSIRGTLPMVFLLFGFYFIPTVNRHGEQISGILLLVFVIVCTFSFFKEIKRLTISSYVSATLVLLILLCTSFFSETYWTSNQRYLENRLKASMVFPKEALFPLLGKPDEESLRTRHQVNFQLLTGSSTIDGELVHLFDSKDAALLKTKYNLRAYFYPHYDQHVSGDNPIDNIVDNYRRQDSIDSFYDKLFHHIEDSIMLKAYDAKKTIKLDIVDFYLHPVSYFSNLVQYSYEQVAYSKELLHLIEQYKRIHPDTSNKNSSTVLFSKAARDFYTMKLSDSFRRARSNLVDVDQSIDIGGQSKSDTKAYFVDFLNFKKYVYYDYYNAAQVIYQSYLNDYQRIGLFVFGGTVLLLGFAVYYSAHDKRFFQVDTDRRSSEISMLTISLIILLILTLPLCRKIEAENINPEQKYWMMNIANWYTPKLFEDVTNPDEKEVPALLKLDTASIKVDVEISTSFVDRAADNPVADTVVINQHNYYNLNNSVDVDALKAIKDELDKFVNQ